MVGLVGANVKIILEVEAEIPGGAPDHAARTVTENNRTLKFTSQGASVSLLCAKRERVAAVLLVAYKLTYVVNIRPILLL